MQKSKKAFTMIELVFVIVVLGILSAVAIPKFAATRADAEVTKGIADVSSIRSAIITERQSRLIIGSSSYIPNGTGTYTIGSKTFKQLDNGGLFGGVLTYPKANIANKNGQWSATAGSGTYIYRINDVNTTFTYTASTGIFTCAASTYCADLTN